MGRLVLFFNNNERAGGKAERGRIGSSDFRRRRSGGPLCSRLVWTLQTNGSCYQTCPPSPNVTHVQVEAEDVPGTSIKYNVVSVPTFILFHGGSEVGRIEGADAPSLVRAIDDLGKKKKAVVAAAKPAAGAPSAEGAAKAQKKLERRMQGIIDSAPVVLFMKGTPSGPQCGFSRKAIATLSAIQVEDGGPLVESKWFNSFNILDDNDVRQ